MPKRFFIILLTALSSVCCMRNVKADDLMPDSGLVKKMQEAKAQLFGYLVDLETMTAAKKHRNQLDYVLMVENKQPVLASEKAREFAILSGSRWFIFDKPGNAMVLRMNISSQTRPVISVKGMINGNIVKVQHIDDTPMQRSSLLRSR